jgi:(E)-4-hydroxy-3-methylbut-2-enyl-diphosphate synthase
MVERKKTKQVKVGDLIIGGEHAITVQSMTTTKTHDVTATLKEVARLEEAGCQLSELQCRTNLQPTHFMKLKKK